MRFSNIVISLVFLVNLSGCVTSLDSTEGKQALKKLENFYLTRAKKLASFKNSCDEDKINTKILQRQRVGAKLNHGFGFPKTDGVKVIGVSGCEFRAMYNVICSPAQSYVAPIWRENHGSTVDPCDVVQEGPAAAAINSRNKKIEDIRKQQEEDRRRKQEESYQRQQNQ